MDPGTIFLFKLRDLAKRSQPHRIADDAQQFEALMTAPLLREFLIDSPTLPDRVKAREDRIEYVCRPLVLHSEIEATAHISMEGAIAYSLDGFDPATAEPTENRPRVALRLSAFLKARVAHYQGVDISVYDCVEFTANAAGGTHYDTRDKKNRPAVRAANDFVQVSGYEPILYGLLAIARVVVRALEPVAADLW